jgi:hypothetical protein
LAACKMMTSALAAVLHVLLRNTRPPPPMQPSLVLGGRAQVCKHRITIADVLAVRIPLRNCLPRSKPTVACCQLTRGRVRFRQPSPWHLSTAPHLCYSCIVWQHTKLIVVIATCCMH